MRRRGGAGEIEDPVEAALEGLGDVVLHHGERAVARQVDDVLMTPGLEVVEPRHDVAALEQPVAQVRSEETRSAGDENAHQPLAACWRAPPTPTGFRPSEIYSTPMALAWAKE